MSWSELEPERHNAHLWVFASVAIGLLAAAVLMLLGWPIAQLYDPWVPAGSGWAYDPSRWPAGFNIQWVQGTGQYLVGVLPNLDVWVDSLVLRFWDLSFDDRTAWAQAWRGWTGTPWMLPAPEWLAAWAFGIVVAMRLGTLNPFSFAYKSQGTARWATREDLVEDRLFCRTGLVMGVYAGEPTDAGEATTTAVRKAIPDVVLAAYDRVAALLNRERIAYVRNWEWLSSMIIAPPGTGKSVLLQTTILADWPDDAEIPSPSLLINDPKGENFDITAAWRATIGPVFKLAWDDNTAHRYNFLSHKALPGGAHRLRLRRTLLAEMKEFYEQPAVSFNQVLRLIERYKDWAARIAAQPGLAGPLRPGREGDASAFIIKAQDEILESQRLYAQLDSAVDRMCACLIPETVEQHWRVTGRAALSGFILYELYTAELRGREATFADLLEWLSGVTDDGFSDPAVIPAQTDENGYHTPGALLGNPNVGSPQAPTGGDAQDDLTAALLDSAIEQAQRFGYPTRCVQELRELRMKPDKERGSVVSTAGSSIAVFKNAAVRRNTSTSDFSLDDLRGMCRTKRNPRGKPITVYFVVQLENAEFLGRLTGLFFDQAAAFLMSEKKEVLEQRRPVRLIADEFWTLPPLEQLQKIPAFGRGQWLALDLVGQSLGQVAQKFGNQGQNVVKTLKGAMSYFVIPTQTDPETAESVSKAIGNRTIVQVAQSRTEGLGQGVNPWATNRNRSLQGIPLFRPEQVMSMEKLDPKKGKKGRLLVQISGAMNRPIWCRPPVWFWDPELKKRDGKSLVIDGLGRKVKADEVLWGNALFGQGYDPKNPRPANDSGQGSREAA